MVLEKCEKTALTEKNFEKKNSQTPFVFLYFNLLTIKIWEQSDKFPLFFLALYSVGFKRKKFIRENSAKHVNQTGNFYFLPEHKTVISLPILSI